MVRWIFWTIPLLAWVCGPACRAESLRDPEALYLQDITGLDPLILKVVGPSPVYATRTLSAHVGNFVPGEEVILIAYHPDSYLLRQNRGKLEGWVSPQYIQEVDPAYLKSAQAAVEEEKTYQAAIKKKEVIAGMTFDHVRKTLGKPDNKSFREDENGRFDQWSYVTYQTVIEQRPYRDPLTGTTYLQSVRVKIPSGSLEVEFKAGRVSAVERIEQNLPRSQNTIRLR